MRLLIKAETAEKAWNYALQHGFILQGSLPTNSGNDSFSVIVKDSPHNSETAARWLLSDRGEYAPGAGYSYGSLLFYDGMIPHKEETSAIKKSSRRGRIPSSRSVASAKSRPTNKVTY